MTGKKERDSREKINPFRHVSSDLLPLSRVHLPVVDPAINGLINRLIINRLINRVLVIQSLLRNLASAPQCNEDHAFNT